MFENSVLSTSIVLVLTLVLALMPALMLALMGQKGD